MWRASLKQIWAMSGSGEYVDVDVWMKCMWRFVLSAYRRLIYRLIKGHPSVCTQRWTLNNVSLEKFLEVWLFGIEQLANFSRTTIKTVKLILYLSKLCNFTPLVLERSKNYRIDKASPDLSISHCSSLFIVIIVLSSVLYIRYIIFIATVFHTYKT